MDGAFVSDLYSWNFADSQSIKFCWWMLNQQNMMNADINFVNDYSADGTLFIYDRKQDYSSYGTKARYIELVVLFCNMYLYHKNF